MKLFTGQKHMSDFKRPKRAAKRAFVLMLGDDGAVLLQTSGANVHRRVFAPTAEPADTTYMMELLRSDPGSPISVLVDQVDQTFAIQSFPPVSAMHINKLVTRRLQRDFAPDDIKGVVPLGRVKTEDRRDWQYLFMAAPCVPPLSRWLELLYEMPNRLEGIYLLPLEAQNIIKQLMATSTRNAARAKRKEKREEGRGVRWQVLVSHHKVGGLRQIVLKNYIFMFTRITQPVGEDTPDVVAGNIEQELLSTKEYIKRLGFRDSDVLDVLVVAAEPVEAHLDTKKIGAQQLTFLTPYLCAEKLKVQRAVEAGDRYNDTVMAVAIMKQPKRLLRLHSDYSKKLARLYSFLRLNRLAAMVIAPIVLLYYVSLMFGGQEVVSDIGLLEKQQLEAMNTLDKLNQDTAKLPDAITRINDYADVYRVLEPGKLNPLIIFSEIGKLLGNNLLVTNIDWATRDVTQMKPPITAQRAPEPEMNMTFSLRYTRDGLEPFLKEIRQFHAKLQEQLPRFDVTIVKLPGAYNTDESVEVQLGKASQGPQVRLQVDFKMVGPLPEKPQANPTPVPPGGGR